MIERWKFWRKPENPWPGYSEATKDYGPRPLLVKAIEYVQHKDRALDLGPGALNESTFLIEQGFQKVTAVNRDPLDEDPVARERAAGFPEGRFEYVESTFDAFTFKPEKYDLVNAQLSLAFNPPETFDRMFASLIRSLKKGGIVTGNFFGPNHSFSKDKTGMTFHTEEQARALLRDCNIIFWKEIDKDDIDAKGRPFHPHTFNFIARKK